MEINWNPSVHQLRAFGLTSLAALPLAAALWSRGSIVAIGCAAAVGAALAATALFSPRRLLPLRVALDLAAWPLLVVLHDVVLLLAFVVVIVPVGLWFRLMGRNALQLKIDRAAVSYWQPKKRPADVRSYFRRW